MRRAAKRDENEQAIVDDLLKVGVLVRKISAPGVPDLLCGHRGSLYLLEVKQGDGKLKPLQEIFFKEFHGYPVAVVRSTEQALEAIGAI